MKTIKKLGIWMDHFNAYLIIFSSEMREPTIISYDYTFQVRKETVGNDDNLMDNMAQHNQNTFYKSIANVIPEYDEVLLFGPTNAKLELYKILKASHLFNNIKIEVQSAGSMSDKDHHAFVHNHFKKFAVYNFKLNLTTL